MFARAFAILKRTIFLRSTCFNHKPLRNFMAIRKFLMTSFFFVSKSLLHNLVTSWLRWCLLWLCCIGVGVALAKVFIIYFCTIFAFQHGLYNHIIRLRMFALFVRSCYRDCHRWVRVPFGGCTYVCVCVCNRFLLIMWFTIVNNIFRGN